MDELIDGTLIGGLCLAAGSLCSLLNRNKGSCVGSMSRCADHVELCRLLSVGALKINFLCALCNVQAVLISHLKGLAICCDGSLAADIKNTDLTAL